MLQTSAITQKGQVTIPVLIRRKWSIQPKQKVAFVVVGDRVELKPAVNFFKLRGSVKSRKKYTDKQINRAIGQYLSQEHAQSR